MTDKIAEYFDVRAESWTAMEDHTRSPLQPAVALMAGVSQDSSVLDIGSGLGVMMPTYLELGATKVLGVDVSPEMVKLAQRRWANTPEISFIAADIAYLETEERFDAIVIYNAYPHLMNREALIRNCAHLLGEEGRFVVAHSTSKEEINVHHDAVAAGVSLGLRSAEEEAAAWEGQFVIDGVVDTPYFYAFCGVKH